MEQLRGWVDASQVRLRCGCVGLGSGVGCACLSWAGWTGVSCSLHRRAPTPFPTIKRPPRDIHVNQLSPKTLNPEPQVDAKLAEEMLRLELSEATASCLDAARSEAAEANGKLVAQLRDLRSNLEGGLGEAAARGRGVGERVGAVEAQVCLGCGGLIGL